MKKIFFLVIIVTCLFLGGIYLEKHLNVDNKSNYIKQESQNVLEQTSKQMTGKDQEIKNIRQQKKKVDSIHFELAKEGRVNGIEFKIGTNKEIILDKWGIPDITGEYEGYLYIAYDNATFFYDDSGIVKQIAFHKNFKTYGINSGMKPDDIKKILGQASYEGMIEIDQAWAMEYFLGEYSVIFYSENKDSPIISGILKIADSTE